MDTSTDTPPQPQTVFVFGVPRSGTTLLQTVLACHPDVATAPETYFFAFAVRSFLFQRSLPPLRKLGIAPRLSRDTARTIAEKISRRTERPVTIHDFALSADGSISPASLALEIFSQLRQGSEPIFVEKTPAHVYFIPEIRQVLPQSVLIHIVRDPRDVFCSFNDMLSRQRKRPRSAFEFSRVWNVSVDAARHHGVHTVRYEDLVTCTDDVMHSICERLGIDWNPSFTDARGRTTSVARTASEDWKDNCLTPVSPSSIGRYRNDLSPHQVSQIERLSGARMARFGYETGAESGGAAFPLCDAAAYYMRRGRRVAAAIVRKLT